MRGVNDVPGLGAVAHVRDEQAGKWWRFDDETVTEIQGGPTAERADHGVGPPRKVSIEPLRPPVFVRTRFQVQCSQSINA